MFHKTFILSVQRMREQSKVETNSISIQLKFFRGKTRRKHNKSSWDVFGQRTIIILYFNSKYLLCWAPPWNDFFWCICFMLWSQFDSHSKTKLKEKLFQGDQIDMLCFSRFITRISLMTRNYDEIITELDHFLEVDLFTHKFSYASPSPHHSMCALRSHH